MKTIIFIFLVMATVPCLAKVPSINKVPIVQRICLKTSDFSPTIIPTNDYVESVIVLPKSFSLTESMSLSLQAFLKDKSKLFVANISINSSPELISMTQDSHGDPMDPSIHFHPIEIAGEIINLTVLLSTQIDNIDSIIVTTIGFQKDVSYSIPSNDLPLDIFKDYTNCNCSQPSHISRNGWGCPQGSWGTSPTLPTHLVIHHEAAGGSSPNSSSNWANRVYSIWNYHFNTLGWSDIGYNWLIDPNGVIYEGRYSSSFADPQGAHWTCNSGSMAVCMLGNYSSATITPLAKASLEALLAWKACQYSIDPVSSSYNSAQMAVLNNVCGHLNGPCSNTVCPGSMLYGQIPSIRSGVLNKINACSSGEDIFITNASVSNNSLSAGDNFTVYATQNYSGSQLDSQLPSFDLDYYLSTDCNIDNGDVLLGGDTSGLGSDDPFNDENENVTIPNGTPNGNYFILFVADNDDELVEVDESNNVACIAITISPAPPEDIFLTNTSVSNTNLMAGDNFDVFATQNYSGSQTDAQLPSFDLDYSLSTDCNFDNGDVLLGGDASGLGSDDPFNDETENLTIPNGTAPGNYFILFVADNDQELIEADETNNVACIAITISVDLPEDIYLTNTSVSSSSLMASDNFDVFATQNYSGSQTDAQLPSFALDYFLSTDCNLDASDVLLGGDFSGLGSDDPFNNETENLTIPTGTSPGFYHVLFVADNSNQLIEVDESNNIACVQIEIIGTPFEDISVSNETANPANVQAGSNIYVTVHQSYSGSQPSSSLNDVALAYYLSTDCTLSSNDVYIGGDFSTIGSDIPTEVETADLTIPSSTTQGNYFILFVGDSNDDFTETDEQNNIQCVPVYVGTIDLSELSAFGILIYPNPTKDFLQIENCDGMELEIIDISGRIVYQKKCSSDHVQVDVSILASGEYTVHFMIEGERVSTKVIKL